MVINPRKLNRTLKHAEQRAVSLAFRQFWESPNGRFAFLYLTTNGCDEKKARAAAKEIFKAGYLAAIKGTTNV